MNKNVIFYTVIAILILLGIFGKGFLNQQNKPSASKTANSNSEQNAVFKQGYTTVRGFNYGFSPKTITVKLGAAVKLNLISDDSPHTFTIDELGVNQQFTYGKDATVIFTASKKGTFQFYCAVPSHKENGMIGTLIVE